MQIVEPKPLPAPMGDFSHAVVAGGLVFISGTVGLKPEGGMPGDGGTGAQTTQTIENIRLILSELDLDLNSIVSATVHLQDMADYGDFTAAWKEAFGDHKPSRATVRSDLLLPMLKVEIQAVAELKGEAKS